MKKSTHGTALSFIVIIISNIGFIGEDQPRYVKNVVENIPCDLMKIKIPKAVRKAAEEELDRRLRGDESVLVGKLSDASKELAYARAQLAYILDPEKKPAEAFYWLVQDHVSLETFQIYAINQRWKEGRDLLYAKARYQLARQLERRVISERLAEMKEIQAVRGNLLETITPIVVINEDGAEIKQWKVEPKSLGEAVRSFRDMHILLELTRKEVLLEMDRMAPEPEVSSKEEQQQFSRDELALIARRLLIARGVESDEEESEEEINEEEEERKQE